VVFVIVAAALAPIAGIINGKSKWVVAGVPSWSTAVPASIEPPMSPELIVLSVKEVPSGMATTTNSPDSLPSSI
jgi:hypothetical protein